MTAERPTALIADDEPLLRDELANMLADAWPELVVVARARNGREAIELFEEKRPDICFLDVQMPGISGVEAAGQIGVADASPFAPILPHSIASASRRRPEVGYARAFLAPG